MTSYRYLLFAIATLLLSNSLLLQAEARQESLSEVDQAFMASQRKAINTLARRHFGRQLTGQKSNDFPLLQRLLDERRVSNQDIKTLQAMGIIFGDIIAKEQALQWTIYIDKYGRSRALAIPKQRDVLFPVTMISRRVQSGASVNIEELYQKALKSTQFIRQQIVVY